MKISKKSLAFYGAYGQTVLEFERQYGDRELSLSEVCIQRNLHMVHIAEMLLRYPLSEGQLDDIRLAALLIIESKGKPAETERWLQQVANPSMSPSDMLLTASDNAADFRELGVGGRYPHLRFNERTRHYKIIAEITSSW